MSVSMKLKRRAVKAFPHRDYLDYVEVKRNRRKWLESVVALGDRWIIAKPVEGTVLKERTNEA